RPPGSLAGGVDEIEGCGGYRGIIDVHHHASGANVASNRLRLERNFGTAPVEQLQHLDHRRLWLDRDDPCPQPAERGDTVAKMGADIENQIATPDEPGV